MAGNQRNMNSVWHRLWPSETCRRSSSCRKDKIINQGVCVIETGHMQTVDATDDRADEDMTTYTSGISDVTSTLQVTGLLKKRSLVINDD
jgi:hypothetical protein